MIQGSCRKSLKESLSGNFIYILLHIEKLKHRRFCVSVNKVISIWVGSSDNDRVEFLGQVFINNDYYHQRS